MDNEQLVDERWFMTLEARRRLIAKVRRQGYMDALDDLKRTNGSRRHEDAIVWLETKILLGEELS